MTQIVSRVKWVMWIVAATGAAASAWLLLAWLAPPSRSLPPPTFTGVAQVGGAFVLTNQRGERVSDKDLFTGNVVLTFGWTYDPDLTPAALQVLAAALASTPAARRSARAAFVTLDPARDTPERLRAFLSAHDPTIVGLTGTDADIKDLASAYKLYWKRIDDASLQGGYSIDFASLYYVMGVGGNFLGVVPYTNDATELAEEIGKLLPR